MKNALKVVIVFLLIFSTFVPPKVRGAANWLDPNWSYRKKITIDKGKIDDNLTDFPVLVKLTSNNFDFSEARSDGYDIRFTSSDGVTLLDYERERHNATDKVAEYWVKIPSVSHTTNTEFYIYYGNQNAATDVSNPDAVWDANTKAVWHMNDLTTFTIKDSTVNGNNGTKYGNMSGEVDGKIGKAQKFDGSNDYVGCWSYGIPRGRDPITYEAWIYMPVEQSHPGWAGVGIVGYTGCHPTGLLVGDESAPVMVVRTKDGFQGCYSGKNLSLNEWHHVVGTFDGTVAKIYVDGVLANTANITGDPLNYITGLEIGKSDSYCFNGAIGEVRISNVARSDAWVEASYHSGNDTLLTYGDEQWLPTIQFTLATSSGPESSTPAQLQLTLLNVSPAFDADVTVDYAVTGGTATGGGVDYTLASGTATIAAHNTTTTIDIPIVNDFIDESNETIEVTISEPTNAPINAKLGTNTVHTYTINDDDLIIQSTAGYGGTISPSGAVTVNYGDSKTFTIKADPGFMIFSVLVDNSPITISNPFTITYTFPNVTSNHTIQAEFIEIPDNTPPTITYISGIDINALSEVKTNKDTYTFTVEAFDESGIGRMVVKVNGVIQIDKNNLDPTIYLTEGVNTVEVIVYDTKGNSTSKTFKVIKDSTPPTITLASDIPESTSHPTLTLKGMVSDNISGVKSLKVNNNDIPFTLDGNFETNITLTQGTNTITIEALDKLGNKGTKVINISYTTQSQSKQSYIIVLKVNSPEITINGISKKIDAQGSKPIIKKGRTLLPIRVIIESLGGTVEWNAKERKVTITLNGHSIILWIGKTTALVDGNKVALDVPPQIINGRTYIPIRFVAENLNASVQWDQPTKTVTIYYWP